MKSSVLFILVVFSCLSACKKNEPVSIGTLQVEISDSKGESRIINYNNVDLTLLNPDKNEPNIIEVLISGTQKGSIDYTTSIFFRRSKLGNSDKILFQSNHIRDNLQSYKLSFIRPEINFVTIPISDTDTYNFKILKEDANNLEAEFKAKVIEITAGRDTLMLTGKLQIQKKNLF
jgi:hypothetical protein